MIFSNMFFSLAISCEGSVITNGRSYMIINDISISGCAFYRHSDYIGQGGVIYSNGNFNIRLYSCMFYGCRASQEGGAVFIICKNAEFDYFCGQKCHNSADINTGAHFGCFEAINSTSIRYGSVTSCSNSSIGYNCMMINGGKQECSNSNITKNICYSSSGTRFNNPESLKCEFSHFERNQASVSIIIYLSGGSSSRLLQNCNIFNNTQGTVHGGIVRVWSGSFQVSKSIISHNTKILFGTNSGTLLISECNIAHTDTSKSGSVTLQSNVAATKSPFPYQLFNTYYCMANPIAIYPAPSREFMQSTRNLVLVYFCLI